MHFQSDGLKYLSILEYLTVLYVSFTFSMTVCRRLNVIKLNLGVFPFPNVGFPGLRELYVPEKLDVHQLNSQRFQCFGDGVASLQHFLTHPADALVCKQLTCH